MRTVKLAAEALDRYYGTADWVDHVDLDRLDLRTDRDCVLGQVFGDVAIGIDELRPSTPFRTIFAFAPLPGMHGWTKRAWANEIRLRRIRREVAVLEADNIVAREYNGILRDRVRRSQP